MVREPLRVYPGGFPGIGDNTLPPLLQHQPAAPKPAPNPNPKGKAALAAGLMPAKGGHLQLITNIVK